MADTGTARSVSGKMMAAGDLSGYGRSDHADVIDADYVEVTPELRRVHPVEDVAGAPVTRMGMAMLDRREGAMLPQRGTTRGGPLFWLAGGLAIVAAFWVSGGHAMMPVTSLLSAARDAPDLQIANVRSRAEAIEGIEALLVDGDIRNEGEIAGRVPALAVQVLSQQGETTIYRLGTLRTPLAPGSKYSFSGRLDMPMDGVKTVLVTFDE